MSRYVKYDANIVCENLLVEFDHVTVFRGNGMMGIGVINLNSIFFRVSWCTSAYSGTWKTYFKMDTCLIDLDREPGYPWYPTIHSNVSYDARNAKYRLAIARSTLPWISINWINLHQCLYASLIHSTWTWSGGSLRRIT